MSGNGISAGWIYVGSRTQLWGFIRMEGTKVPSVKWGIQHVASGGGKDNASSCGRSVHLNFPNGWWRVSLLHGRREQHMCVRLLPELWT